MGTGVRTSMPMIVADELEADWTRVHVVQAPGDEASTATRTPTARAACAISSSRCAAAAPPRAQMLEQAAAAALGRAGDRGARRRTTRSSTAPSGRKLGYGELAADAAKACRCRRVDRPASSRTRRTSATSARARSSIVDLHDITTGKAQYGADVRLPGMMYAVVARPPVVGGKVASFDASRGAEGAGRREGRRDRRLRRRRRSSSRSAASR